MYESSSQNELEEGSELSKRTSISCKVTETESCKAGGELTAGTLFRSFIFVREFGTDLRS